MAQIRMTVHDEGADDPDLRRAIDHFTLGADRTSADTWALDFETDLHSLAFSRATAGRRLTLGARPGVDADGFEDWSVAGRGEVEPSTRILPENAPPGPDGAMVFRYEMAWIKTETADPPPRALVGKLGLAESMSGGGSWIWRAVKLGWRLTGALDVRDEIAIWLAREAWQKLDRQNAEWRAEIQRWEADQRLIVEARAQRHVRLNSGSARERAKWQHHYAVIDKLIRLGV
ncbi:hypothetical protein [Actinokineospora sp. HUAS TT18]|uniref:hypothetical protein n=1 Tax=Actinokineospora sp. HUAS TT18 TaxID=3447451 RepID=UPI003F5217F6